MTNQTSYCGYGHKLKESWGGTLICLPCVQEELMEEQAVQFAKYARENGVCYMCGTGEASIPSIGSSLILQGQGYCIDCVSTCLIVDVREGAVREAVEAVRNREEEMALLKQEEDRLAKEETLEAVCENRDYRRRW